MAKNYMILVHNDNRRLTLDMTGCKDLGERVVDPQGGQVPKKYISICWKCARPVGRCPWLLKGIPAKGSEYYWWKPVYDKECEPSVAYIIASCPKYIAPQ